MPELYRAKDMVQLGISLAMSKDFMKDQGDIIKKFYAHCFGHRFLLAQRDKDTLNQIF